MTDSNIFAEQKRLYTDSYEKHAGSPKATMQVHRDYQNLRFDRILEQIDISLLEDNISLLDYACGQGDLLSYISTKQLPITYFGIDINEHYINYAKSKFNDSNGIFQLQDTQFPSLTENYDYICVSGMFHYKGSATHTEWESICIRIIDRLFKHTKKGLIFNCLTSKVDFMDKNLFYWDADLVTNYVQTSLSRHYKIDHSYPLYEWTISVYTDDFIQSKFDKPTFKKYF